MEVSYKPWISRKGLGQEFGKFVEIITPKFEAIETLFSSTGKLEGVAKVSQSLSGPITEHQYPGGMIDRMPFS